MSAKIALARRLRGLLGLDSDRVVAHRDATYAALASLSSHYRSRDLGTDLRLAEQRVYSQNGEDGVLCAILTALGIEHGRFVEFGVEDGSECCTRFLAEILGWSGTYIEPDAASFARLHGRWQRTERVRTIKATVTPDNIDDLVAEPAPDLLVIDVDGQDYHLWAATSVAPAVVVVEYNAELHEQVEPPGKPWSRPHRNSGAGLEPLRLLGESKGYRLVHTDATGVNAFFVRSDLAFVGLTDRTVNHYLQGVGQARDSGDTRDLC